MRALLKLRLYYGKASYDAQGKIQSRNEPMSIEYDTIEYANFMKQLKTNGITDVKVEKAYDLDSPDKNEPVESLKKYKEIEDVSKFQEEIKTYLVVPEKELTPEQKQIKELQEQVAALTSASKPAGKAAAAKDKE